MQNIELNNKNFWKAQAYGWALFAGSNVAVQAFFDFPPALIFYNTLMATSSGLLVTTIYREIIRHYEWKKVEPIKLILFILAASFFLALSWVLIMACLYILLTGKTQLSKVEIFGNIVNGGLTFLIWNFIYFFFQYFYRFQQAEIERWKLLAEVRDAQLGTLKSQIRPHFMFNTLNNILALILEDKFKARVMLINFSELLRYSLKMSKASFIAIDEEVEMIRRYLQLLSIQYEHRLQYEIDVKEELLDHQIPPMMLQLLVENGIKHGIDQESKGGLLKIDIFQLGDQIHIEVKNPGSLSQKASLESRIGIGLENIKERLQLLYKGKASFRIKEKAARVIATIIIPIFYESVDY